MMKFFPKLTLGMLAPFIAVVFGLVIFFFEPLPLQVLRNAVFDQYQRWHPRPYQSVPVRIIDIDEESLRKLGQWPWPRTRLACLIERLRKNGVMTFFCPGSLHSRLESACRQGVRRTDSGPYHPDRRLGAGPYGSALQPDGNHHARRGSPRSGS